MDTKDRRPGAPPDGAAVPVPVSTRRRAGRYYGASDSGVEEKLRRAMEADGNVPPFLQQAVFDFGGPDHPDGIPATITVDFYIPSCALVVEVDGYTFHYTEGAFTADRRKDRAHALAGRRTIRFAATEVTADPARCASIVAAVANTHHGLEVF